MHDTHYTSRVNTIYSYIRMALQCKTITPKQVFMIAQHCFLKISQCKWSLLLNDEDCEISSPHLFSSEDGKCGQKFLMNAYFPLNSNESFQVSIFL